MAALADLQEDQLLFPDSDNNQQGELTVLGRHNPSPLLPKQVIDWSLHPHSRVEGQTPQKRCWEFTSVSNWKPLQVGPS